MKLTFVTHYGEDDVYFEGDELGFSLHSEDGTLIEAWGPEEYYCVHSERKGFLRGVEWVTGEKVEVAYEKEADTPLGQYSWPGLT